MLTESQQAIVKGLLAQGYENSAQIAKLAGLTHEYVDAYMDMLDKAGVEAGISEVANGEMPELQPQTEEESLQEVQAGNKPDVVPMA